MLFNTILSTQMNFVSLTGSFTWFGGFLVGLITILLFAQKKYLEISFILISLGSYVYSLLLKGIFQLPRPITASLSNIALDKYTFPSTHVVSYTVIFGFMLYLLFTTKLADKLLEFCLKATLGYLVLFVGISRVILGQHFARDVIFGYVFGGIYLYMQLYLYKRLKNSMAKYQENNRQSRNSSN